MKIVIIFSFLLLTACSTNSKNIVRTGEYIISGGESFSGSIEGKLIFKRVSWYSEMTMLVDFLYTDITVQSPYFEWFSSTEKSLIKSCSNPMIVAYYTIIGDQVETLVVENELKKSDAEIIVAKSFSKQMSMHPIFNELSYGQYKIRAVCKKSARDIVFEIPGFSRQVLN